MFGDDAEVNMVLSTIIEKGKAGYEEFAVKMEKQAELRKRVDEQLAHYLTFGKLQPVPLLIYS